MKKRILILFMIFILTLTTVLSANAANIHDDDNKLILSIPVGKGEGNIAYTKAVSEMEKFGPESFAVANNGNIYILDSVEKQVEIFNTSAGFIKTINLPNNEEYYDIEIRSDGNIILLTYGFEIIELSKQGILVDKKNMDNDEKEVNINLCNLYKNKNNDIVIRDYLKYTETDIDSSNVENQLDFIDIIKNKNDSSETILSYQGENISVKYEYESAGTYPLRQTLQGDLIIQENEALIGKKIYIENRFSKYNNGKLLSTALALPTINYETIPNKYICSDENGNVYQMVLNTNSIDIYNLVFANTRKSNISTELATSILNESEISISENTNIGVETLSSLNHYYIAGFMADYSWDFDYSTMLTPSTSTTTPPQHLNESSEDGYQIGIPYKWGGFDGNTVFQDRLDDGKTAGDIDTDAVVSSTAGIDCSGFISRAYGFTFKLGTSTISNYFSSINWNDIYAGDIANKVNYHVWMYENTAYDANNNILGYYTMESTTDGSEDAAKYWYRSLSDAQNYTPMVID